MSFPVQLFMLKHQGQSSSHLHGSARRSARGGAGFGAHRRLGTALRCVDFRFTTSGVALRLSTSPEVRAGGAAFSAEAAAATAARCGRSGKVRRGRGRRWREGGRPRSDAGPRVPAGVRRLSPSPRLGRSFLRLPPLPSRFTFVRRSADLPSLSPSGAVTGWLLHKWQKNFASRCAPQVVNVAGGVNSCSGSFIVEGF